MMTKHSYSTWIAALLLAVSPVSAQAETGLYGGVGLSYGSADSHDNLFGISSEDQGAAIGLTLGYRMEQGKLFYGPELDADLFLNGGFAFGGTPCSTSASGPYYCDRDHVVRLRAVVGTSVGNGYEMFGSIGYGVVTGEGATNFNVQDGGVSGGATIGIGIQRALAAGGVLRFEVIHDRFTDTLEHPNTGPLEGPWSPEYEATSVKVGYLIDF